MIKVNIRTVFISTITVSSFEKTVILTSTSHVMDLDWIYSKIYWNHTDKVFDIDRLLLLSTAHQSTFFLINEWATYNQIRVVVFFLFFNSRQWLRLCWHCCMIAKTTSQIIEMTIMVLTSRGVCLHMKP